MHYVQPEFKLIYKAMKSRLWIILSSSLNVAALGVLYVQWHSQRVAIPINPSPEAAEGSKVGAAPAASSVEVANVPAVAGSRFNWNQLESDDWSVYIANLRATGCPEEIVRDIFLPKINRLFAPKVAAVIGSRGPARYWQKATRVRTDMSALRELRREKSALVQKLLGFDPDQELSKADPEDQKFDFLPESKRVQLRVIKDRYSDLIDQVRAKGANGLATQQDLKEIADLEKSQTAEISKWLTKDEQLDYDLRTSPVASRLQRELDAFQPGEAEFRAIFQTKQALDRIDESNPVSAEQTKLEVEQQLKTALGEQRYGEYIRDKSPDYQFLVKLANRFVLDPQVASQVYDYDHAVQSQVQQIVSAPYASPGERQAAIQALHEQTVQSLGGLLGNEACALYSDLKSDWWKSALK